MERFNQLREEAREINRQRASKNPEQAQQLRNFENGKYEKISALIVQYVDLKSANASSPDEILNRLDFTGEFSRMNRLVDGEVCRNLGLKIHPSGPAFHFPNELSTISQHHFAASKDSQQPEVDLPAQSNSRSASSHNYNQQNQQQAPYKFSDSGLQNGSYVHSVATKYENLSNVAQKENTSDGFKQIKLTSITGQNVNQNELIAQLQAENNKLRTELMELKRKQGKQTDEVDVSRQNIEQTTKLAALQSEYDQSAAKNAKLERDLAKERADNKKSKEQIQQLNRKCENVELFAVEIQKFIDKCRRADRNILLQSQAPGQSMQIQKNVSIFNDTLQASQMPGKRDTLRRSNLFSSTTNGAVIQLSHRPEQRTETFSRQLDLNEVFREFQACFEHKNLKIQYFTQTKGELRAMRSILDDIKKQFQQLSRAFSRGLEDRFNDILVSVSMLFKKGRGSGTILKKSKGVNFQQTVKETDYDDLSQIRVFNNNKGNIIEVIKEDFPKVSPIFVRDKAFEVKQLGGKAKHLLENENTSLFLLDFTCEQGHTVNLLKVVNPLTFPRVKILFSCCAEYGGKLYDGLRLKQSVTDKGSLVQIQVQNPQEYVQFCNIVDQKMLSLQQISNDWIYEIQMHFYNEELTARIKSFIVQICHAPDTHCHQILDGIAGQEGVKFIIV